MELVVLLLVRCLFHVLSIQHSHAKLSMNHSHRDSKNNCQFATDDEEFVRWKHQLNMKYDLCVGQVVAIANAHKYCKSQFYHLL